MRIIVTVSAVCKTRMHWWSGNYLANHEGQRYGNLLYIDFSLFLEFHFASLNVCSQINFKPFSDESYFYSFLCLRELKKILFDRGREIIFDDIRSCFIVMYFWPLERKRNKAIMFFHAEILLELMNSFITKEINAIRTYFVYNWQEYKVCL